MAKQMTLTEIVIYILATWRIVSLISVEKGPFDIFRKLRRRIETGSFIDRLIECTWCVSLWVAFGWLIFGIRYPNIAIWVALPFAFSTGAILIDGIIYRDE